MPYPSTADYGGGANSRYYYLPAGWDTAWKTAKQNVGSQRVNVVGIGDSIIAGQGSTDMNIDAWWPKMRSSILAANGNALGGDHYGILYTARNGLASATHPTFLDATGSNYFSAFNVTSFSSTVAATPFFSCTPPYAVTAFDIWYMDYATGSWNYNVDGGSNTTVNTTGPGTAAGAIVKKISVTGLSSATHTLNCNSLASTANTCNILGITGYASTNGFCFANMGWGGQGLVTGNATNNALADTGKFPPDRLSLYQGYQGTTVAPAQLTGLGFPSQPDLAIIAFGINDATQNVTRANFRDSLDRLIWSLRYGKNDACSIIICACYIADGTLGTATSVTNTDYTSAVSTAYRDIKAAMLECAQVNTCAFVDVHGAFGRTPVVNGWSTSVSDIHPTSAGYLKMANLFNAIL